MAARKQFIDMAQRLYFAQPVEQDSEVYDYWLRVVHDVADHFGRFNPRFDRSRFIEACENDLWE